MAHPRIIGGRLVATGNGAVGIYCVGDTDIAHVHDIEATTPIEISAGAVAYVVGAQFDPTAIGGAGALASLPGDRAVWDALGYQARHANDIDDAAGIHHTLAQSDRRYLKRTDLLTPPPRLDAIGSAQQVVNSNVGTFGDATHSVQVTLDRFGRVTRARSIPIIERGVSSGLESSLPSGVASHVLTFNGVTNHWASAAPSEPLLLEDGTIAILENGHAAMSEPVFD